MKMKSFVLFLISGVVFFKTSTALPKGGNEEEDIEKERRELARLRLRNQATQDQLRREMASFDVIIENLRAEQPLIYSEVATPISPPAGDDLDDISDNEDCLENVSEM